MKMELCMDANKDLRLLDLRGLSPLNPDVAAGETDLLTAIEDHNARCDRAAAGLRQVIEDCRRLCEFDTCRDMDGCALLAERSRLSGATWDALLELRHVLEEREEVLQQIAQQLRARYGVAHQEHHEMVEAAERRLVKERRRLEQTNPGTAGSHFAELVEDDDSVRTAAERSASSRRAFEDAAEARRNVAGDLRAVTARQREVFKALIG